MAIGETIGVKNKYIQALLAEGMNTSPIRHWTQGASRLAHALLGGLELGKAEKDDREALPTILDSIGRQQGASPASVPAAQPNYNSAVANIESGGKYDALGPVTKTGDRAYGKYQVMGANVGPWSKRHTGTEMTAEQFLADPKAQDAVFNGQFGSYAQKYGPQGAARAWFAGEGGMNDPNRKDQLGTTVAQYEQKFNRGLGQPQAPALPPPGQGPDQAQLQRLRALASHPNEKVRAFAGQIIQKLVADQMIPQKPKYEKLNDDTLYEQGSGRTMPVGPGYRPLVDPAERAKFGIPANDLRPYQVGPAGRLINPPPESRAETTINNAVNPILSGVGDRFNKKFELAEAAKPQIEGIHEARRALDEGAITGAFADSKLFASKVAQLFGLSSADASNTEVMRSAVGNQVLAKAKTLGANPTDADRRYIEAVVGGQIGLEEKTIRRLLDMQERWARDAIKGANAAGAKMLAAQPKELQNVAPMMTVDEPVTYDEYIKANPVQTKPQAAPPIQEGSTATGPNGQKIIWKNGRWVPMR